MGMENEDFDVTSAVDSISADLFDGEEASPVEVVGEGDDLPELAEGDSAEPAEGGEEPAETPAPSEPTDEEPPAATATEPQLAPPKTWRPEAAAKWQTLPPEVQREVLKREDDIFRGIEGYKADAEIGKSVQRILSPYMPMLQAAGLRPLDQVEGLMKAHHALATGTPEQKSLLFQRLAQDYGVSLENLSGEQPFVDPQVAALQSQLAGLQSRLMEREAREADAARQALQEELNTFASDPAHQYFDEVAGDIAALLRAGAASSLADAYEKAVWTNPATRAKEQARLTAESEASKAAEAKRKIEEARKASSVNVTTRPKAVSAAAPVGSIDDTLNATLAAIRSRA